MLTIVKLIFGSHLYGTNTELSDKDFKGIFMPTKEQIFLGKIPKSYHQTTGNSLSKNTSEDIDYEIYSLHYFIELACQGQTVALDMLHTPENMVLESSNIWEKIVSERHRFYTKSLNAFVGYARKQASKYGIKGSRLNDAKRVLNFIDGFYAYDRDIKLKELWDVLPTGEHIFKQEPDVNGIRMYEVCGRKVGETTSLSYLYEVVNNFYKNYGARAKMAAENKGIDWKAISHALRAAYQTKEILTQNTITFPLKEAEYLRAVKQGEFDYSTVVAPKLEELMYEVEELSLQSKLPKKVDRKFWDNFIIQKVDNYLFEESHYNGI